LSFVPSPFTTAMMASEMPAAIRPYLTDALTRIVNGHPNSDIDQLLPWAYRKPDLQAVA
jgi:hypothetical protein